VSGGDSLFAPGDHEGSEEERGRGSAGVTHPVLRGQRRRRLLTKNSEILTASECLLPISMYYTPECITLSDTVPCSCTEIAIT